MVVPAKDLYAILGVVRSASQASIGSAYRDLARQFHPDVNSNDPDAERKFREVQAAFDILSDRERRREYDSERLRSVDRHPPQEDYYTTLGVHRNATSDEIVAAYREVMHARGTDERVETAFEVLRDPDLRRQYNDTAISFATTRNIPCAAQRWGVRVQ